MNRLRLLTLVVVVVLLLSGTVYIVFAHGNANPRILPPNSRVEGLTYGEWSAKWWQYIFSLPTAENPLTGGTGANCVFQRIGNVGLIAANPESDSEITCQVPNGMKLYLDILSAECSTVEEPPFYGGNEEELRTCAEGFILHDVEATIDGVAVRNLDQYVDTSPLFEFTLPTDNILGVDAGTTAQSVSNGAHLMLAPLTPGEHTVHLHVSYPDLPFTADTTYHFIVTR